MLNQLTLSQLTQKLASGEISARQIVESCLAQIGRVDGKIHAFLSYNAEDALAQADAADKALAAGATHAEKPLLGLPIGIKDVIAVKDPGQLHFAL